MDSDNNYKGPVNIGNPTEFSILELAENIIKLTKTKSKIVHKSLPEDDPKQRQPDITLVKEKLKWETKVKLNDGLWLGPAPCVLEKRAGFYRFQCHIVSPTRTRLIKNLSLIRARNRGPLFGCLAKITNKKAKIC